MILTGHTIKARMYDDTELRMYEVAELDGVLYSREGTRQDPPRGIGGWAAIHSGIERCAGNFGWRVVRV